MPGQAGLSRLGCRARSAHSSDSAAAPLRRSSRSANYISATTGTTSAVGTLPPCDCYALDVAPPRRNGAEPLHGHETRLNMCRAARFPGLAARTDQGRCRRDLTAGRGAAYLAEHQALPGCRRQVSPLPDAQLIWLSQAPESPPAGRPGFLDGLRHWFRGPGTGNGLRSGKSGPRHHECRYAGTPVTVDLQAGVRWDLLWPIFVDCSSGAAAVAVGVP